MLKIVDHLQEAFVSGLILAQLSGIGNADRFTSPWRRSSAPTATTSAHRIVGAARMAVAASRSAVQGVGRQMKE